MDLEQVKKDYYKVQKKYYNACNKVDEASTQTLKEILDVLPNKSTDTTFYEEYSVAISYDGGNHPEYNSDVFAQVEQVSLKDGKILVDTSYEYNKDFEDLTTSEKDAVTDAVISYVQNEIFLD